MGRAKASRGGRAIAAAAETAGHPGDARAVCAAAEAGAPWAGAIVARSARAVAGLLGDRAAILGLDRVALGGGIGLSPGYLDRVRLALQAEPALFRPEVVPAGLGADAPLFGALLHRTEVPAE